MKYVQGAGATAAGAKDLASQLDKKLTLAPKVVQRAPRASLSPNRAAVAKAAPVPVIKAAAKAPAPKAAG